MPITKTNETQIDITCPTLQQHDMQNGMATVTAHSPNSNNSDWKLTRKRKKRRIVRITNDSRHISIIKHIKAQPANKTTYK